MTGEELKTLGIPLASYNDIDVLYVESALEWILRNTTLEFSKSDPEAIKALPAGAKLFIVKYREIISSSAVTTSESVDGLSQSFSDAIKGEKLMEYAQELMGDYVFQIRFTPAVKRWDEGRKCFICP